ncbi:MAG: tyrosine-type recombinase/integrase [Bacteroidota bacterium]
MLGKPYRKQFVQQIMGRAVKKFGVNSYATVHTLRHSFTTHLLELETDLRYIQSRRYFGTRTWIYQDTCISVGMQAKD